MEGAYGYNTGSPTRYAYSTNKAPAHGLRHSEQPRARLYATLEEDTEHTHVLAEHYCAGRMHDRSKKKTRPPAKEETECTPQQDQPPDERTDLPDVPGGDAAVPMSAEEGIDAEDATLSVW